MAGVTVSLFSLDANTLINAEAVSSLRQRVDTNGNVVGTMVYTMDGQVAWAEGQSIAAVQALMAPPTDTGPDGDDGGADAEPDNN